MKVWVVAGEYWHPNSAIYEGCVLEVCSTKELADHVASTSIPSMATKSQVYEMWLLEPS